MLKDLKVTLYEIFGYVLPGGLFFLAVFTIFWSIFLPHVSAPVRVNTPETIAIILLASYFSGHVVQALGNVLAKVTQVTDSSIAEEIAVEIGCLYDVVRRDVVQKLNVNESDLKLADIVRITDETNVQVGVTGDREVYQYREGFYRGLSVACIMLTIAIVVRMVAGPPGVEYLDVAYKLTMNMLVFCIIITASGAVLFHYRFIRFAKYRVRHGFISYLIITSIKRQLKER